MKLLNTTTYHIEEFFAEAIPPYAILSHCWEVEEVLFQDLDPSRTRTDGARKKKGWSKIEGSCRQSLEDGFTWVWIDTCCIDKSSSADLSEAINSMFKWYQKASICYVYLFDVQDEHPNDDIEGGRLNEAAFIRCKWFTRGWTLQELLAPAALVFFDRRWNRLGNSYELDKWIAHASGIQNRRDFETASIAQKFSWAAKRMTTREEDRAYSLLGLFGINMPPLYGEGENAFLRLQLEIIKISDDESIFAWTDNFQLFSGLLARSPNAFLRSGNIVRMQDDELDRPSYGMTNKGLRLESHLLKAPFQSELFDIESYDFILNCTDIFWGRVIIRLRRVHGDTYARINLATLDRLYPHAHRDSQKLRQVFHVVQTGPYLKFRGPYKLTTQLGHGLRKRFYFSHKKTDMAFSTPVRARWYKSADSEAVFETCELPYSSGTEAAITFREIKSDNNQNKSKDQDTFVLAIKIWQGKVSYGVFCLRKNEDGSSQEFRIDSGKYHYTDSNIKVTELYSGSDVKTKLHSLDDAGLRYRIAMGLVMKNDGISNVSIDLI